MSNDGLTPGHEFLRKAAQTWFAENYGNPIMHIDTQLSSKLEWVPALRFMLHRYINVFVEPSDDGPYPRILHMKHAEVSNYPEPIAIYCVCQEAATATVRGQQELRRLKAHGFGLITVNSDGEAHVLFPAIPLVQVIPQESFKQQLQGLPRAICQPASEAFQDYRANPLNGVKTLSELVESMIMKAGQDSAKLGGITRTQSKAALADVLDALYGEYPPARAAIGGARNFIREYRNLAHHSPRNKKDAYKKCTDCKHHFLEGLRTIQTFRNAMKNVDLTGNLTRV
ncbi:MAG: hypothetical protein F4193_06925 [Candidatus Dadabacteria bacterium]|nr:hypothetical protein [Gammaproteobacteria bacterium]MYG83533.1 hypothetical protein [Candidatus Dadabacteria bacterium]